MARVVSFRGVVLCWLVLVSFMATPAVAARKLSKGGHVISFAIRAWCIPRTESLLLEHEDRHECVYSLKNGDRAVGVGYDLDDDKETRRSELSTVLADYDKVYKGLQCLNTVQISALLALDTRRALDRAAKSVKALDEQCCSVMAVFGDIQHSSGKDAFEGNGFQDFIEAVSAKEWKKAGDKLNETSWCNDNKERCVSNKALIYQGCGGMKPAVITQVINQKP
ncbi:hypothetical protein M758_3G189300 [Ceratodon purpureus]|nr:hypothetical protein M758_3G189300 [Ceratodon purpureus]